jgi:hypothetical protein
MTRAKSQPSSNANGSEKHSDEPKLEGLFVTGVVVNRWKRMLDSGMEVVNYQIGDTVVTVYGSGQNYYPIGAQVTLQVRVSVYATKSGGLRYSLIVPTMHHAGEF